MGLELIGQLLVAWGPEAIALIRAGVKLWRTSQPTEADILAFCDSADDSYRERRAASGITSPLPPTNPAP